MSVLQFSEDGHFLYGGSGTGMKFARYRNSIYVGNAFRNFAKKEEYPHWSHSVDFALSQ